MSTIATMSDAGERLKSARESAGFSSARAAAGALDIPESTYRAYETGMRGFGPDQARKFARRFHVDAAWILLGKPGSLPGSPGGMAEEVKAFRADANAGIPEPESDFLYYARVADHSLDYMGYLPGDVLLFDFGPKQPKPETGDVVIVQHYGEEFANGARTIMREFVAPGLVITNSSKGNEPPIDLEVEDAEIRAVMVRRFGNAGRAHQTAGTGNKK